MPETKSQHDNLKRIALATALSVGGMACVPSQTESSSKPASESTELNDKLPDNVRIISEDFGENKSEYSPNVSVQSLGLGSIVPDWMDERYVTAKREEGPDQKYLPLAELRKNPKTGELTLTDNSPEGMDSLLLDWFANRFMSRSELVKEVFSGDQVNRIIIALGNDQRDKDQTHNSESGHLFGYFNNDDDSLVFEISAQVGLKNFQNDFFEQYITHEMLHPLLAEMPVSYFSDANPTPNQLATFASACTNLRDVTLNSIKHEARGIAQLMQTVSELQTDPAHKERFIGTAELFRNGSWIEYQDTAIAGEKLTECIYAYPTRVANLYATKTGIPALSESAADKMPLEAVGEKIDDIRTSFYKLMKKSSTFQSLNEGTYLLDAPSMGHGWDGWDELAASMTNIMITFPDELALNLRHIDTVERDAILAMYRLNIDGLIEAHPKLRKYLTEQEAEFMTVLNQ